MSTGMVNSSSCNEQQIQEQQQEIPNVVKKEEESTTATTCTPDWHNVVAGAMAGATSRLGAAPFDLLRIRRQLAHGQTQHESIWVSLKEIVHSEGGLSSLFRGNMAATHLWIGYSAIQFSLYSRMHDTLISQREHHDNNSILPQTLGAISFVSGASAGFVATLATYPFDITRTIFAAQGLLQQTTTTTTTAAKHFTPPKSIWEFASRLYQQQGLIGFYAGSGAAVIQIIPYMGLTFCIHDELMEWSHRSGFGISGLAGMVSGGVSKLLVYPLDTVKKRLQAQVVMSSTKSSSRYNGTLDCLVKMTRQEGVRSLYNGLAPSVLKNMVGTGISFACFTFTKDLLEKLHHHQ